MDDLQGAGSTTTGYGEFVNPNKPAAQSNVMKAAKVNPFAGGPMIRYDHNAAMAGQPQSGDTNPNDGPSGDLLRAFLLPRYMM